MAIRIVRNEAGNCINFYGSSNPTYWNACLSAQVDEDVAGTINIINDVITSQTGVTQYEFYRIPYTEFTDADGNGFADAQTTADYITANANVIGFSSDSSTDLTGETVCFKLDDTSTSIMLDNGHSFGVNTIRAVDTGDGLISIKSELGDITYFTKLDHTQVCGNDGNMVSGGLVDVINYLNELFTVGAFEAVIITDPDATTIADVGGVDAGYTLEGNDAIDPIGDSIFTNSGSGNYAGLKSTATIDQVGEYFTFDIKGEGQLGFGLIHSDNSYNNNKYSGSSTYADPSSFAVGNSAHYGFQFSHWFHPTPNGSWTNYGANTAYSMREHWSNWDKKQDWLDGQAVKVRVGIDNNGYISIETKNDDGTWGVHSRTSYPQLEGAEFHLGIKIASNSSSVVSQPKVHLLPEVAPTMYFRYIESPDGTYQYPLFATTDEAEYYDEEEGGTGTYHSHVYPDDPSNTTWYMPDTNSTMTATVEPINAQTFNGQNINWTEITSLTNADLIPPAFADTSITVDELSLVNYQVSPVDVGYVTTIGGIPAFSIVDGTTIRGTAPEVTGDNVANPSDVTTITVYRTNSYGSSTGTLTINITNLTAPIVTPITGVTDEGGTALIDSDTMDDGSVISIDNVVNVGNRFTFDKEWVDNYVLPKITSGTGAKSVFIGFPQSSANWSAISSGDFLLGYQFYSDDTTRAANNWKLRVLVNGVLQYNVGVGGQTSGLYDYALINDGADIKIGSLVASQGNNISTYVYNFSGVDSTWKYTGGLSGVSSQSRDVIIATSGTDMDIDLQYFGEYTEPAAPTSLSSFTKALDFSGGAEHALQTNNSIYSNPLNMGGISSQVSTPSAAGHTSSSTSARPWATAIIFKYDGNSSNQHIWNQGEGSGSTDDNIYLRLDSSGYLYFGWGRQGELNECRFIYLGTGANVNHWHGIYIAHNGTRLGGNTATAANLAAAFDIRWFTTNSTGGTWGTSLDNKSTAANWTAGSTGGRMDRLFNGRMSIGGRGSNRTFHGKVASMVVTSLRVGQPMPNNAEIESMMNDPEQWLTDYRVGMAVRNAHSYTSSSWGGSGVVSSGYGNTQIWLMGDGTNDSYSNGIRNEVAPNDQNYTKLQLNSMVSNDIQTININGLT